jgi:dual specificity MAP kinase phosphatase
MFAGLQLKESAAAVLFVLTAADVLPDCACRAPACNVVLEHLSISRQHAQFTVDLSGSVCLMDLGSQHGTKLNDAWLKAQQQRTMTVGSTVSFGASTRKYKLLEVVKV